MPPCLPTRQGQQTVLHHRQESLLFPSLPPPLSQGCPSHPAQKGQGPRGNKARGGAPCSPFSQSFRPRSPCLSSRQRSQPLKRTARQATRSKKRKDIFHHVQAPVVPQAAKSFTKQAQFDHQQAVHNCLHKRRQHGLSQVPRQTAMGNNQGRAQG